MSDIIVLGSCSVDFTCFAARLPKAGETIHGKKFMTSFGGKGANQCVSAAKLGGKTALIANLGNDKWGIEYKTYLEKLSINTAQVHLKSDYDTGIAHISVAESGENQIIIVAGANGSLTPGHVETMKDVWDSAKILVCQLETPIDATLAALKHFKGISILNAAPAQPCTNDDLLKLPSIFCVNEVEASIISGIDVSNVEEANTAISIFLQRGCRTIIVTLGAEGAVFASQEDPVPIFVPAKKVAPTDTTPSGLSDRILGEITLEAQGETDRVQLKATTTNSEAEKMEQCWWLAGGRRRERDPDTNTRSDGQPEVHDTRGHTQGDTLRKMHAESKNLPKNHNMKKK
ncbi:ribokinase-like [Ctenocephalides felis]|uniref:ribokinase-like n=1 Tax=Ctenocephalides felis TaxID=7515 RepID=UPI000E6E30B5|nr:ribokinase-like [Ctenocephalides felis]